MRRSADERSDRSDQAAEEKEGRDGRRRGHWLGETDHATDERLGRGRHGWSRSRRGTRTDYDFERDQEAD